MPHMHLQSLKLLCPTVKEEMHIQKNTLYELGVKDRYDVSQYPPHHINDTPAKFEVAASNSLVENAFTRKYTI